MNEDVRLKIGNLLMAILSTVISAIPLLAFCYFAEQRLSPLLFEVFLSFFIAFVLEHFYRKLRVAVICDGEEGACGGWFSPKFLGRAWLLVVIAVCLKWVTALIILNLPFEFQGILPIVSLTLSLMVYFITYFSYSSFLAYSFDDASFFEGFAKGFAVVNDNIVYFIVAAVAVWAVSCIPVIGYVCSLAVFAVTEFIKAVMYANYREAEEEYCYEGDDYYMFC